MAHPILGERVHDEPALTRSLADFQYHIQTDVNALLPQYMESSIPHRVLTGISGIVSRLPQLDMEDEVCVALRKFHEIVIEYGFMGKKPDATDPRLIDISQRLGLIEQKPTTPDSQLSGTL